MYLSLQEYVDEIKDRTKPGGQEARRKLHVPIVHIPKPQVTTILPKDHGRLVIDPAYGDFSSARGNGYQRLLENRNVVGILRDVLRRGGSLPPIHVCSRRRFGNGDDRSLLFIADGRTRAQAAIMEGKRIEALLYQFESKEDEALFFQIQTGVTPVDPNVVIAGSSTPAATWLRKLSLDFEHPMCGRIAFGQGRNAKEEFRASTMLPCLLVVICISSGGGSKAMHQLERISGALKNEKQRARLELFVRLLPAVFPGEIYSANAMRVFAKIAREKWEDGEPFMPNRRALQRLVRLNWSGVGGGASPKKWWILAEAEVRRCWK